MHWLEQAWAVTRLNLATLRERRGAALATVFGVAGVVAVFVAVLSIGEGFRRTLATAGSEDTALVLRSGSDSEMMSVLLRDDAQIIGQAPGVARAPLAAGGAAGAAAAPLASAELFVVVDVPKRSTGTPANVPLRGVQPAAFAARDDLKIVKGRMFDWGKNEVIAGEAAARQFAVDVGSSMRWGQNEWQVVGLFAAGGALWESELWCDVGVLQPAYRRGNSFQSVVAKLESPAAFDRFKSALTTDPRLDVKVQRQSEFYAEQSRAMTAIIQGLGTSIAVLMGIGAVFGALNTMYSAVAARTREIGTLRALGFGNGPVVASVLVESIVLSLLGGTLGALLAYFAFDGFRTSTMNFQTFSQVAFAFQVTPALLAQGIAYALVMGLLGGLFPAIRAARLPVATALREL
ncbi:MAG TPA: ABC transporter permease [Thermoanaerobaculia bacterium]|nr:ABC transporter permease [Thermoanaerobaculia bacterium]